VPVDPSRGFAVLVVDDSEDNRFAARAALAGQRYEVVEAVGGAEAIAIFEAARPDCILLDVRMPDMDGFEVCARIRALPHGLETPIIFLTGLRDLETFDRALSAGGTDYLTKPIHGPELVVRVQAAIKLRKMSTELREQYELLKHQRDVLQRVQLQKERLMSFVVHDLKNPVSSMDLHAQVLLRDKTLPPSLRDSATQIRTEARQLTRMILNLLDISKGDEGLLSPRWSSVDLPALAHEIELELAVMARAGDVQLAVTIDLPNVRADADLLRLSASSHDGVTELRVRDAGVGIPLSMREKIFDPFVQLEETGDGAPISRTGRGLGLAFCKVAVEAHCGRIWVEDAGPGAVFCVSLPITA
jgi:two-component system sensor histidine kinase/response regulator